jgi:hypothetical protein
MPAGVQGTGPGMPEGEAPHVDRVQAVDVLVRVHLQQRGLEVDLLRGRVLHQHGVDRGVVVHLPDRRHDVGLRGVVGRCRCGLVNPSERARSIFMFT